MWRTVAVATVLGLAIAVGVLASLLLSGSRRTVNDRSRLELTFRALPRFVMGARVTSASLSESGLVALGTERGEVRLLDARSHRAVGPVVARVGDGTAIDRLAFSADGSALAALTRGGWLWAWSIGEPIAATTRVHPTMAAQLGPTFDDTLDASALAVGSHAQEVAVAGFNVVMYDLPVARHRVFVQKLTPQSYGGKPRTGSPYEAIALNDSAELVAANTGGIDTWDIHSGRHLRPVLRCGCGADGVSLTPDGRMAAFGTGAGHAVVYDVPASRAIADKTIAVELHIFNAIAARHADVVLVGEQDGGLVVWDRRTGRTLGGAEIAGVNNIRPVAVTRSGDVALVESEGRRWTVDLR